MNSIILYSINNNRISHSLFSKKKINNHVYRENRVFTLYIVPTLHSFFLLFDENETLKSCVGGF